MEFLALVYGDPDRWESLPEDERSAAYDGYVLLQDSRRDARLSAEGELVLLAGQDRSLWDAQEIDEDLRISSTRRRCGGAGRTSSSRRSRPGMRRDRARRRSRPHTPRCSRSTPSPVARLNHAVAVALAGDPRRGLELVDAIDGLHEYRHFHSARADLLRRLDRREEAHAAYARALALTDGGPERRFLERRLGETAALTPE